MRIRVKKRAEVTGGFPAADKDKYIPGTMGVEGCSIPLEYTAEGELVHPLQVGQSMIMNREFRNGVKASGIFVSSPIIEITQDSFMTRNSVYDYEYLTPDPEKV